MNEMSVPICTWNLRLVNEDGYITIREVYYDDNLPILSSSPNLEIGGNMEEIKSEINNRLIAMSLPVIDFEEIKMNYESYAKKHRKQNIHLDRLSELDEELGLND
jgi:hypothetical protein